MNLTYGIIVAVGLLVAAILGMIAMDPGYLSNTPIISQSEKPLACTLEWTPVCGVDDVTYGNLCMLKAAEVDFVYNGECVSSGGIPTTEPESIPVKPVMTGWDRLESVQDPGVGHEQHQIAIILPPSDKVYSGKLMYDASENIQLVTLHGPLADGEDKGQAIWTPDGETKFALTFVDPMNAKGEWIFAGNALAVHTKNPTPFIVDYKVDYTEKSMSDIVMTGTIQSVQDPGMGHESHQLAVILAPSSDVYSGTLSYSASEPIQLVSLRGPLGPDEKPERTWTPDGETIFELTFVDPKNAMGSWEFSGNALAVHTMNPTPFTVSYSESATATAGKPAPESPVMGMPVMPQTREVSIVEGSGAPGCEATNECYIPYSLEINLGDTVSWSNDDTAAHTVTSGSAADGPSGVFDSGLLMTANSFEFTFTETGTYPYFCIVHPWMTGEIIVTEFEETEVFSEPSNESPSEEPIVEEKRAALPEVILAEGSGAPGCEATNECYIPYQLEVYSGESVIWGNPDSAAHTVTSGVPGSPNGMFDSGMMMPNQSFEYHFVESGEYDYYCMVHPWMIGKVMVN